MAGVRSLISLLSLTLLLSFLSIFAHDSNLLNHNIESSPIRSLKHLRGCHKGQKVRGLIKLKSYLEHYGYLSYGHSGRNLSQANDDYFDDLLESAVKYYQTNFNINATGIVDSATVSHMEMPRCGFPDIINGTTRMRSGMKMHNYSNNGSASFHTVSHYSFHPGKPRWKRFYLNYGFLSEASRAARNAFYIAANQWTHHTRFHLRNISNPDVADIKILFASGKHGSCPIIFTDEALSHTSPPEFGNIHMNADKPWSRHLLAGFYHLETLALHEFGHALGLSHASDPESLMWPHFEPGVGRGLTDDDINGINYLYSNLHS